MALEECPHGALARKCELCEKDAEIQRLSTGLRIASRYIDVLELCMDGYYRPGLQEEYKEWESVRYTF